ncbi:MAG: hypothetical protein HKN33_11615, partial [Pyrinomonadaceae bacterium]|nr:hypothetical protein [Pyrinomonadaceae bacterium]
MNKYPNSLLLAFIFLLALTCAAFAQTPASSLLKPLRAEHAKSTALVSEVRIFINSGTRDRQKISELGDRILECMASNRAIIDRYDRATTRFGLQEEYDHIRGLVKQSYYLTLAYGRLTGADRRSPVKAEEREARNAARDFIGRSLKVAIVSVLERKGLADYLTRDGFEEAVSEVDRRLSAKILSDFEPEIQTLLVAGLRGNINVKDWVRNSLTHIAVRNLAKLVARVTSNSLVIEFVAGPILRWVGEKLRRLLRPRGNLDARTKRSVEVLENAANRLNGLEGRAGLLSVRLILNTSNDAIESTKFLVSDISRSDRKDLAARMFAAIDRLDRTIKLTKKRFLIDSDLMSQDFKIILEALERDAGIIRNMQANMNPGKRDPILPPEAPAAKDDIGGTYGAFSETQMKSGVLGDFERTLSLTGNRSSVRFVYKIY